jgi:predicted nucleotidyltransferase
VNEQANAEVVFGSASRGDADRLSDRDILLIDTDTEVLRRRQTQLELEGWSVAAYTWRRFDSLTLRGALFVQHLKLEGTIVEDKSSRLKAALREFRPKVSYTNEIVDNAALANLISVRPNSEIGRLWAADVLYVTIRNFGILCLAEHHKYMFAYADILEALAENKYISFEAIPRLSDLREAKAAYRAKDCSFKDRKGFSLNAALADLPRPHFPDSSTGVAASDILSHSSVLSCEQTPYARLRNLERSYLALVEEAPDVAGATPFSALRRWIENPRCYVWTAVAFEDGLIDQLKHAGHRACNAVTSHRNLCTQNVTTTA